MNKFRSLSSKTNYLKKCGHPKNYKCCCFGEINSGPGYDLISEMNLKKSRYRRNENSELSEP